MDKCNQHSFWLKKALKEAKKAYGLTSPNPLVGAIIVKEEKLLATGYHHKAGSPHAEIEALQKAGSDAKNACLYVTLEPCSTSGRTPACVHSIINAGISKVVIGSLDVNPKHCGKAVKILQGNGIEVIYGVDSSLCWNLNLPFSCWVRYKRPMVILKMAMTLDGKIATAAGESRWITGPVSRQRVQRLRQWADAILVGSETVRKDNPSLRVYKKTWPCQPQRYIYSRGDSFDKSFNVFNNDGRSAEIICPHSSEQWQQELQKMADKNITSLLIEGGGEMAGIALQAGIVDQVVFYIAPKILTGRSSRPVVGGSDPLALSSSLPLRRPRSRASGEDFEISGFLSDIDLEPHFDLP